MPDNLQIENWGELKPKAQRKWCELTDRDLYEIAGRILELEAVVQRRCDLTEQEARLQVADFLDFPDGS